MSHFTQNLLPQIILSFVICKKKSHPKWQYFRILNTAPKLLFDSWVWYFLWWQYASWDLAFHMIPMADIDVQFAKDQLLLFLREWYLHPNGQVCYLSLFFIVIRFLFNTVYRVIFIPSFFTLLHLQTCKYFRLTQYLKIV